jgi:hypothetical protein
MVADIDKLSLIVNSLPKYRAGPTLPRRNNPSPLPPAREDDNKQYDYTNYSEEWVKARETTDKFDGNLFDLRKYGFSILTGLITAGSFLGFSEATQFIQVGVIIVTMVLVVILYWLDIFYQGLLYGAVFRTRFLEIFRLNRGLSIYISGLYGASNLGRLLHFLYVGFLIGVFLLGLFVANFAIFEASDDRSIDSATTASTNETESDTNQTFLDISIYWLNLGLIISVISALVGIVVIYVFCDRRRTEAVRQLSSLFKYYYDQREDPDIVIEVEEQLNILFDRYL